MSSDKCWLNLQILRCIDLLLHSIAFYHPLCIAIITFFFLKYFTPIFPGKCFLVFLKDLKKVQAIPKNWFIITVLKTKMSRPTHYRVEETKSTPWINFCWTCLYQNCRLPKFTTIFLFFAYGQYRFRRHNIVILMSFRRSFLIINLSYCTNYVIWQQLLNIKFVQYSCEHKINWKLKFKSVKNKRWHLSSWR